MLKKMRDRWRVLTARGYITVIIGIIMFLKPQMSIYGMLQIFSVLLVLSGISYMILGFISEKENMILRISESLLFFTAAVLIFFGPAYSNINSFFAVSGWAAITGLADILFSLKKRKKLSDEWLIVIHGLFTLLFAYINAFGIFHGTSLMIIVFGTYLLISGGLIIVYTYRIKYLRIWKL